MSAIFLRGVAMTLFVVSITACQSTSTTNYPERTNQRNFTVDASGSSYTVTLFPRTYSALAGSSFGLVLVSPVLLKDEILYNSGVSSVIPWFNARGISVWLVRIPPQINLEQFGRETLPAVTAAIRQNSNDDAWVMGGVSLGGQAVAHYLADAPRHATVTGMPVKAAFFLGTGFDYNYPDSFTRRLTAAPADLCSTQLCTNYLPGMPAAFVQPRSALFDARGRAVWREVIDGAALRDKGVRLFVAAGKIDNVAPSEAVYRFYTQALGDERKTSPDMRFLQPGRMNRHTADFDHTMMVASKELASDILPEILRWIDL
jgi:pimeloyl-ACP methyl ester carboxylesterase